MSYGMAHAGPAKTEIHHRPNHLEGLTYKRRSQNVLLVGCHPLSNEKVPQITHEAPAHECCLMRNSEMAMSKADDAER